MDLTTDEKLRALRESIKKHGCAAYVVPSPDFHQSEYVADCFRARAWFSGFTGSVGTVVVTMDKACLWADGRYWIQAEKQLAGSSVELFKMGMLGVPAWHEWVAGELAEGAALGFDGRLMSVSEAKRLRKQTEPKNIKLMYGLDLVSEIWANRPAFPATEVFEHDVVFAGKTRTQKLALVREKMSKKGAGGYLISSLDDNCWLFNIRANDVSYLPVTYCYSYIEQNKAVLFIDAAKLNPALAKSLAGDGIEIMPYASVFEFLKGINPGSIFINPDRVSMSLLEAIPRGTRTVEERDITTCLKAVKDEAEIKNIRRSQIKDGVALVKFIMWLKEAVKTEELEEADIHGILTERFRKQQEHCLGASFQTIAAYRENAALMHYSPVKGSSKKLEARDMLLVDCGGQYLDGTTDITRTFILGEITDEMKRDFTLVLKGHINLARAKFLHGANGNSLDTFARMPLWEAGSDYKCGSGHGIGYCLSVHEGPQGFGMRNQDYIFEPNMLLTNEPGIYKEGRHGIRHENTMLVVEDETNECGTFLKFETISFCPIDLAGIDKSLLTAGETEWLNAYHAATYDKLSPYLNDEEKAWLRENTRAV